MTNDFWETEIQVKETLAVTVITAAVVIMLEVAEAVQAKEVVTLHLTKQVLVEMV